MFERGIRGGIMQSVHRWAAANNPYRGSEYDKNRPTKYLQYLDANNLYGWAMSQPLPTGGFHWVELRKDWRPKTIIEELAAKKNYGYLLEVDVRYPKSLHDYHNDLPFMCAKMKINGVEKLVLNFYYKKKYVIHIKALKQAIDHGPVLERIHRCIEFKQSAWMKEFIDFNTRLRTEAKNDFGKDFYKLMNNLDSSKTTIRYEFYYDYMIPKYGGRLKLCYMDTDSLIYSIKIKHFYSDISPDVESRFDTSGYPNNGSLPLPIGKNKKVIGLMKDELGDKIMKEFVSLRPKMYTYRVGNSEPKKCKRIKKCVVKKTISFDDYKACLFSGERSHRSQPLFRSQKHEVKTLEVNKLALSREDD